MAKFPWRLQCDIPYGQNNPVVTIFMGEYANGGFVHDTSDPVELRLSELTLDVNRLRQIQDDKNAKRQEKLAQMKAEEAIAAKATETKVAEDTKAEAEMKAEAEKRDATKAEAIKRAQAASDRESRKGSKVL